MKKTLFASAIVTALILSACGNSKEATETPKTDSTANTAAQDSTKAPEDKTKRESPPKEAAFDLNGVNVKVAWGSPKVKGREVWGKLVPYGEVWRSGANEATTIEFGSNAKVGGKDIPAGKYGFFSIPDKKEWTLIFNTRPDQWGAYEYEKEKDQLRISAKPEAGEMKEELEFFAENGKLYLAWEKLKVGFSVEAGK